VDIDDASFAEAARLALGRREPIEPGVHLVMGELEREVRHCLAQPETHADALRLLRFVETMVSDPRAPSELANAVAISFVELHDLDALDRAELEATCPTVFAILRDQASRR
jgi:hypothetical protein